MDAAAYPAGHGCAPGNGGGIFESCGDPGATSGVGAQSGFKTGHRGDHRLWRGNPASGASSDPASPDPHLPPPSELETAKPATEVTTDFGAERQGPRAFVDLIPHEPTPESTFEPGAAKPATEVTSEAVLPPPAADLRWVDRPPLTK